MTKTVLFIQILNVVYKIDQWLFSIRKLVQYNGIQDFILD